MLLTKSFEAFAAPETDLLGGGGGSGGAGGGGGAPQGLPGWSLP